jgi:Membrane carboxypeptidase/penicillin-binding protein
MNFGKNATEQKQKSIKSFADKIGKKAGFSLAKILFFSFIAIAVIGVCLGNGIVKGLIEGAPDIADVNIIPSGQATFIYDSNGIELQKLTASASNRTSISIDKMPFNLQHAIVAIEDERFYQHDGVDFRGIIRAFTIGASNGFNFTEGASTITQQLLKNNVFVDWTTEGKMERFKRKFQEQYLALQLEKSLSKNGQNPKDVILENYLNTINLGAGTYGVQAAAYRYFGKTSEELNLSECAVLAAIPQNPTKFNPINHPVNNSERRAKVLGNMLKQEYITREEYKEALADNVYDRIKENDDSRGAPSPYSYFIDELIDQVTTDLQTQKGYTSVQAYNALYSSGLRIHATQDPRIQGICDEEYANPENFPSTTQVGVDWALSVKKANDELQHYSVQMLRVHFEKQDPEFDLLFDTTDEAQSYIDQYKAAVILPGETIVAERTNFSPQPQSSVTVIDQHTGFVKAIIGGRGKKDASLTLNRATSTYRQPGSTFKPLSTYAPALDIGETLATTYKDEPFEYPNTNKPVRNWLTNTYRGDTTIRYAIEQSINVVAVKCLEAITPQVGFNYLKDFGFSRIISSEVIDGDVWTDVQLPMALGGITHGVSNIELTAAYATLANKGVYTKPIFYTQILDSKNNVILENLPQTTRVVKESTAYLMTNAMIDVVTQGTGRNLQLDNMTVSGKTGTTSLYKDLWFAGYTPYYTCAIWSGYDNNEILPPDDTFRKYHQNIWRKVMMRIHEGLSDPGFTMPDSVASATICDKTGNLAGNGCTRVTELFEKSTIPTKRCTACYVPPTPIPPPPEVTPVPDSLELFEPVAPPVEAPLVDSDIVITEETTEITE